MVLSEDELSSHGSFGDLPSPPSDWMPSPGARQLGFVGGGDDSSSEGTLTSVCSDGETDFEDANEFVDLGGKEHPDPSSAGCLPKRQRLNPHSIPPRVVRRASDVRAEKCGLSGIVFRRMLRLRLPCWFFTILMLLATSTTVTQTSDVKCVEFFAGIKEVTRAMSAYGPSIPFEINDSPIKEDFNGDMGLLNSIQLVRRCSPEHSIIFFATVCSTWVWVARASTGRHKGRALGNTEYQCVSEANIQVSRMCLLASFALCKLVHWCLEQPASSMMPWHFRMRDLVADTLYLTQPFTNTFTFMGSFGAPTQKPTRLFSSAPGMASMKRKRPSHLVNLGEKATVRKVKLKNGRTLVFGNRKNLKDSQAYPRDFCEKFAQNFDDNLKPWDGVAWDGDDDSVDDDISDTWDDCDVDSLLQEHHISKDKWCL